MSFPTTLSESNDLQILLFHCQEYRRAAAPSGPLSYVEPAVNRQPGFRRELVEQSATFKSSFLKFPPSGAIGIE